MPHKNGAPPMKWKEISELLRLKGWTQAQLARELQISPAAVCRWREGDRTPGKPAVILMRQWLTQAKEKKETVPA